MKSLFYKQALVTVFSLIVFSVTFAREHNVSAAFLLTTAAGACGAGLFLVTSIGAIKYGSDYALAFLTMVLSNIILAITVTHIMTVTMITFVAMFILFIAFQIVLYGKRENQSYWKVTQAVLAQMILCSGLTTAVIMLS